MCGCAKNKNAVVAGQPGLTADQLITNGTHVWAQYNGKHASTTRRGPATNERYSVNHTRCVLMAKADFEAFNRGEFELCNGEAKAKPAKVTGPVTKLRGVVEVDIPVSEDATDDIALDLEDAEPVVGRGKVVGPVTKLAPVAKPVADVVDISELTVVNALPLIEKADAELLDLYEEQEADKETGERTTIMAAIEKRRAELNA